MMKNNLNQRWLYLILGVASMLFAGMIYAWSILKAPFTAFWTAPQLALNFTITMTCFCLGGFVGAKMSNRFGIRLSIIAAGVLSCAGFALTATVDGSSVVMLYLSYGVLAGLGIGIAYNAVISTVNAWFPDKKGLCSGCLMMGFGASSLVIGGLASRVMTAWGWQKAYLLVGIALGAVLVITALILRKPDANVVFPAPKAKKALAGENFEMRDYATGEMVKRLSFWMAFVCIGLLAAVGNSVISFARDLALSVGAEATLATTLVGVLSVCNGLGRIFTGALFDAKGRRFTMLAANLLTIAAAGVTLLAVTQGSLAVCIAGLCLVGMSYGACPTVASAFVSAFYGTKHFPTNFSIINFNLIAASLMATACGSLLTSSGGYSAPFALLLGLSVGALVLNLLIKKP
jgi:OFA family oxalate/formate antiporter-like MFS transporter